MRKIAVKLGKFCQWIVYFTVLAASRGNKLEEFSAKSKSLDTDTVSLTKKWTSSNLATKRTL